MSPTILRLTVAALLALGLPAAVHAEQYPAWGDSGWVYGSKRQCCDTAIATAQAYSAQACLDSGGVPRPTSGGARRGTCSSQWMQAEDGGIFYRCYGEAAVWCR